MKTSLLLALLILSQNSFAGIRDKAQERIMKRMEEKPAPDALTDVTSKISKPGTYTYKISVNGLDRYYMIHIPASYKETVPAPLLFSLHGGGGNMKLQATDKYYKQISKSEALGFIAVFPNGYSKFKSGSFATWNAGNCCADARDKNIDDVAFIRELLKTLSQQLTIDQQKIYATGMSNGAMMAYRLACEMPETFKAIAAVAGTDNTTECKPSRPISILHIHALNDDHVQFQGGAGRAAARVAKVTDFKSVPHTVAKWIELNKCDGKSTRIQFNKGAYCDVYSNCAQNTKVQLCVTPKGGHSWPGGKNPLGVIRPFQHLSATDVMWDFFK